MEQKTADKVRVIINVNSKNYRIYKKVPYIIPIVEENGKFITGQDLTTKQMMTVKTPKGQIIEPESLTEEQKVKYPFVIDPSKSYKVKHLDWLNKNDPYQFSIYNLMLLSGKWAENKSIFENNPVIFHGYFEDAIGEAIAKNSVKLERFQAESEVRNASIEDYKRIALIFSFNVPDAMISIKASKDVLFGQLIELCDTHPKQIKACFHKYNPGIDKDIFILECIDAGIIVRKDKGGDLWYNSEYIGATIDDVKRYLGSRENERLNIVWQSKLDARNGRALSVNEQSNTGERKDDMMLIMECKSHILDGNLESASKVLIKINKEMNPEEFRSLNEKIEDLKVARESSKQNALVEKFVEELSPLSIDQIQGKISHVKSNYDPEACKDYWTNKEALIEYMVKVKFAKK